MKFGSWIALVAFGLTAGGPALAHDPDPALAKAPPAAPYERVSDLVKLPEFIPGLGQIFVDPATLPAGPFLAYDRDGALVSMGMPRFEELTPVELANLRHYIRTEAARLREKK